MSPAVKIASLALVASAAAAAMTGGPTRPAEPVPVAFKGDPTDDLRPELRLLTRRDAGNGVYTVYVEDSGTTCGTWTAQTGVLHEAGPGLNVLFGNTSPGTSDTTLRSYTSGNDYRTGNPPCSAMCSQDAPEVDIVRQDGVDVGIVLTWTFRDGRATIRFTQEVVVEGPVDGSETVDNTVIRETHVVENLGPGALEYGLRKHWDWQIGPDDGPWFADCDFPDEACDRSMDLYADGRGDGRFPPTYVINDDPADSRCPNAVRPVEPNGCSGRPTYIVAGTVSEPSPLSPPPDEPELLQFNAWDELVGDCWLPPLDDRALCGALRNPIDDTSVAYFYGLDAPLVLSSGASAEFTQYVVAGESECPEVVEPPTLECDAGGPYDEACDGATADIPLDGTASSDEGEPDVEWTTDCPGGVFDDPTLEDPVLTLDAGECLTECTVTLTVSQGSGDDRTSVTCDAPVTVRDDSPPMLDCPGDLTVECEDGGITRDHPEVSAWLASASAFDECLGDPVTVTDDLADFVAFRGCPTVRPVTFTAEDACGNVATCVRDLVIQDTAAPDLSCPDDRLFECGTPVGDLDEWLASASATDDCAGERDVSAPLLTREEPCSGSFIETYEFSAEDDCGNRATCTREWSQQDTMPPDVTPPADRTVECGAGDVDEQLQDFLDQATAFDACAGDVAVSSELAGVEPLCGGSERRRYRFFATDPCGNTGEAFAFFELADATAPELSGVPADATVECDAVPEPASPTASDGCDPAPSIAFDQTDTRGDDSECAGQRYTITRTWTATDGCGNETVDQQVIEVVDTAPPLLDGVPPDATAECDDVPEPPVVTAADGCDSSPEVAFSETDDRGADSACSGQEYTITRTWTATDNCGNESTATQTIEVRDATAPSISGVPADVTVECDDVPAPAAPTASDACDPDPELTFNEATTRGDDDECRGQSYSITRMWTAVDNCGNARSEVQRITVEDTVAPELAGVPADITVSCDDVPPPAEPSATDACDPDPEIALDETSTRGPSDECSGQTYTITRTWTATDNCGNARSESQRIVVEDRMAPTLDGVPPDVTVDCDDVPPPAMPTATDDCDPDPEIAFEESSTQGRAGTCANAMYTITRTWTTTDNCGNASSASQTIEVRDTSPPTFDDVPADATVECDDVPPPPMLTARDDCGDADVTFDESSTQGSPDTCAGQQYVITRTWTATDPCGNATTAEQRLDVVDTTAPSITGIPSALTVECDDVPPPGAPIVTDACDPDPTVAFDETSDQGPADDCSGQQYTITRTWTATDNCGNEASFVQAIEVRDTTAPAIAGVPADATTECHDVPPPAAPTATDECDPDPVLALSETETPGDCVDERLFERTWTATDNCGNESAVTQRITVIDTTPPIPLAALEPFAPTSAGSAAPPLSPLSARSACSAPTSGVFRVSVSATDNCDPEPALLAQLLASRHVVSPEGECFEEVETFEVTDGELVEIRLVAPPCPATAPRSARSPRSATSGLLVVEGERVVLRLTATDRCGNSASAEADPTAAPEPDPTGSGEPPCDDPLVDGTCCPAIRAPALPDCDGEPPCGG